MPRLKRIDMGEMEKPPTNEILVPTGCTLLNLALSNSIDGGYIPGSIVNIIGDKHAGKTLLLWTLYAEVIRHSIFKEYRLIYDEPESAFFMNAERMFGVPKGRVETNHISRTIQNWQAYIIQEMKKDERIIYGLDSLDALTSIEEQERMDDLIKSGDVSGSYKTEKARITGEILRNICGNIFDTKSLLIIISQTRDKIGITFGKSKTRSGGQALGFFSSYEMWLSVRGSITRTIKGKPYIIGSNVIISIEKNRGTGRQIKIELPILTDYGIDNTNANIDFLLTNKVWDKKGLKIDSNGVFPEMTQTALVNHIESEGKETELANLVGITWKEIIDTLRSDRKPRYSLNES